MFDFNEALNIARQEVDKAIAAEPELSRAEVEEVRLDRQTASIWIFTADIPKLIKQGWVPGAITVLLDKHDGHLLTAEEEASFHKNWEHTRRRAGFIRQK